MLTCHCTGTSGVVKTATPTITHEKSRSVIQKRRSTKGSSMKKVLLTDSLTAGSDQRERETRSTQIRDAERERESD